MPYVLSQGACSDNGSCCIEQETKAEVANLIRDTLWNELPDDYAPDKIVEFKDIIYQYVFTRYTDVA